MNRVDYCILVIEYFSFVVYWHICDDISVQQHAPSVKFQLAMLLPMVYFSGKQAGRDS